MKNPVETLVVDNFRGYWTDFPYGDINSGRSWSAVAAGANPFRVPGALTWSNAPVQINSAEDVITDLIMAGKERVESGILYVYAIGHTGRLYKIQVNDPATYNPDYDNAILLATISINSPTFTRGGFMDFYGATEQIYIGHDKGITKINFNGTGEAFVGALGSYTQNVPRPLKQFVGNLYFGNGANIGEIASTATVTTYTKLSPGFPDNTQARDIDVSTDGNYLQMIVTRLALPSIFSTNQNADESASTDSYIIKWNGTDKGYTSYNTFNSFSLVTNQNFGDYQYVFGYNMYGPALYNPIRQIWNLLGTNAPMPNAVTTSGNLMTWMVPTTFNGVLEADLITIGPYTSEMGADWTLWDQMFFNAKAPETDIVAVPYCQVISNAGIGFSSNGYADNVFSNSKMYFSTMETSSGTTKYRFYKWTTSVNLNIPDTNPIHGDNPAYYQTQIQMFSKKMRIPEVRVYGQPWVTDNAFTIDLIGSDGSPLPNGSYSFDTANGTLVAGTDYAWYNPNAGPTYALGVAITNNGATNHIITKIEIDYAVGGK